MKKKTRNNLLLSLAMAGVMLGTGGALALSSMSAEAATATANKGTIDVYLIGGQSNAVGYGMDPSGRLAAQDSRFKNGFDNVLYYGAQERWDNAVLNDEFQEVKIGFGVNSNSAGAEIGIASVLGDTNTMNAVIKCAWGATHIYPDSVYDISRAQGTWTSPSYLAENNVDTSENPLIGRMYNWFVQTVTDGIELLIEEGYTPVIKGMWWMQGEAEMFTDYMSSQYDELLRALIKDVRKDVSKISGSDCSEMPFVFGLPIWNSNNAANTPPFQNAVRANMQTVANDATLKNVFSVDCNFNGHVQQDDWHFDAATQKYLGEQFMGRLDEATEGVKASFKEDLSVFRSAQIRTNAPMGIRFGARIANYDKSNKYKYGMLILPTDYLATYASEIAAAKNDYIAAFKSSNIEIANMECGVNTGDFDGNGYTETYIQGSLVDIKYDNLNRPFTGIGYIYDETTGKYLYTGAQESWTVSSAANEDIGDYESTDPVYEGIYKYINGGINQMNGVPEENGYEPATLTLIAPDSLTLDYGELLKSTKLEVQQSPAMGYRMQYVSSDENVVKVSKDGMLTPAGLGTATVTVTCFAATKEVTVNVTRFTQDGITLDGEKETKYGEAREVTLSGDRWYNVSAVKTANGVYIYTQALFNTTAKTSSWGNSTDFEFKLNGNPSQCYVALGNQAYGVTQFVSKVEQQGGKYLHTFEFFVDKSLIPNWSDSADVQLNYAWKSPNEASAITSGLIDYRYQLCWGNNDAWHAMHREGGLSTGFNKLVDNLKISESGLKVITAAPAGSGITIDGVVDTNETSVYGANQLNATGITGTTTNVKATVINGNLYLALTITHGAWSSVFTGDGWWQTDNVEMYVANHYGAVIFANNELFLPSFVTEGKAITTQSGDKQVTTIEMCIAGDREVYQVRLCANGNGFGWNEIAWNGGAASITASGITAKAPITVEGVNLDGELTDSAYTQTVKNSAITTTANGANVNIIGTKLEKGVLFGITIKHKKAANVSVNGDANAWYAYLNTEFRFNGNTESFFCTAVNNCQFTNLSAYCKTVNNGDGTYTSTFEYYVAYADIGVTRESTIKFGMGGWFETGWAWLFGGGETATTHTVTENGIA